jgi:hypothetical protein
LTAITVTSNKKMTSFITQQSVCYASPSKPTTRVTHKIEDQSTKHPLFSLKLVRRFTTKSKHHNTPTSHKKTHECIVAVSPGASPVLKDTRGLLSSSKTQTSDLATVKRNLADLFSSRPEEDNSIRETYRCIEPSNAGEQQVEIVQECKAHKPLHHGDQTGIPVNKSKNKVTNKKSSKKKRKPIISFTSFNPMTNPFRMA